MLSSRNRVQTSQTMVIALKGAVRLASRLYLTSVRCASIRHKRDSTMIIRWRLEGQCTAVQLCKPRGSPSLLLSLPQCYVTSRSRVYQRFCKYCVELVASLSFTFTHTEWFRLTYRFKKRRCTLPYLANGRPSSLAGNMTYLETFVHKYSGLFTDSLSITTTLPDAFTNTSARFRLCV